MPQIDFLSPTGVVLDLSANSKRAVLKTLSLLAGELTGLSNQEILSTLWERESIGSTAIGHGIAIPHGRLRGLTRPLGLFARLAHGIEFEAMDKQPVDLVFVLLLPAEATPDSLKALANVSRKLRNSDVAQGLRTLNHAIDIHSLLTAP